MKKEIYINDKGYSIAQEVFSTLEFVQKEMQELVNNNQFKSDNYKNLKKLFTTFLKLEIKKNQATNKKLDSEIYYYTC